jgi:hypothetical protein
MTTIAYCEVMSMITGSNFVNNESAEFASLHKPDEDSTNLQPNKEFSHVNLQSLSRLLNDLRLQRKDAAAKLEAAQKYLDKVDSDIASVVRVESLLRENQPLVNGSGVLDAVDIEKIKQGIAGVRTAKNAVIKIFSIVAPLIHEPFNPNIVNGILVQLGYASDERKANASVYNVVQQFPEVFLKRGRGLYLLNHEKLSQLE